MKLSTDSDQADRRGWKDRNGAWMAVTDWPREESRELGGWTAAAALSHSLVLSAAVSMVRS